MAVSAEKEQTPPGVTEAINEIDRALQEAKASEAKVEDQGLVHCPRCGINLQSKNQPSPSESDIKEYVRCLLQKKRFSKTYTLFGGQVTMRFELLGQKDSALLGKLLDGLSRQEPLKMASEAFRIKLLFYLRQFNADSFTPPTTEENWEDQYFQRFSAYGEDVPVLACRVLMEFTRLTEQLPSSGLDMGFYKGAGLV